MDEQINKEILEELRKQTKLTKKMNMYSLIMILIAIVVIVVTRQYTHKKYLAEPDKASPPMTWQDISSSFDKGDYEKALKTAKTLTEKNPKYWYGYSYLGSIYTAQGDLKNAEINYSKAYELFPIKDNKENLDAIRKVINKL